MARTLTWARPASSSWVKPAATRWRRRRSPKVAGEPASIPAPSAWSAARDRLPTARARPSYRVAPALQTGLRG